MEFELVGQLTGYKAGERYCTITVKPLSVPTWIEKPDRASSFVLRCDPKITPATLPHGKTVIIRGEMARCFREWKDPTGKTKDIENFRFLALKIDVHP